MAQTNSTCVGAAAPIPDSDRKSAGVFSVSGSQAYVLGIIDPQAERQRLSKRAEIITRGIRGIEAKLDNEGFLAKAPPELVMRERQRLAGLKDELKALRESLEALE